MSVKNLDNYLAIQCGCSNLANLAVDVKAKQLELLKNTVNYARAKSRFYSQLPEINSWADFGKLALTKSSDIANWQDFLCVSQGEIDRIVTLQSSGTRSEPKKLAFTLADLEPTIDFFAYGMQEIVKAGDRLLVLLPGAERPYGVTDLLTRALKRINVQVFPGNPKLSLESLEQDLLKYAASALVAMPSQLELLLELLETKPELAMKFKLKSILSSAELLNESLAKKIKKYYTLVDHYGLTETAYGLALECLEGQAYHLRELDIYVEILDALSLKPLAAGQAGELVITTLSRQAMPLIRYRTGDMAVYLPKPCACGSKMPVLAKILGRIVLNSDTYKIINSVKGEYYARNLENNL